MSQEKDALAAGEEMEIEEEKSEVKEVRNIFSLHTLSKSISKGLIAAYLYQKYC